MMHKGKRAATALLLTLLGGQTAWAVPSRPVCVDIYNHQYLRYDGRTLPLVGASGEYLPHVSNSASQDFFATLESYPAYIDELVGKGLNTMRLWISLADVASPPLPHETPFCYNPVGTATSYTCDNAGGPNKWDLTKWDNTYFANLKAVLAYAAKGGAANDTSKAVIVEVTLFDSFSGQFDGPWAVGNNLQTYGFTDRTYLSAYETATGDSTTANVQARTKQVELMKKVATELKTFYNFYWELANEPDIRASQGAIPNKTAWATFMANELYNHETTLGVHHLIGVNFHHTTALANAGANSKIQIVNSHYVDLDDTISPSRLSATQMIRANNVPSGGFDKVFGFNEGRITPSYLGSGFYVKPEATRAEAWEFMLNGGGVFDHLGYDWRGTTEPVQVRTELGRLNTFLSAFHLRNMDRAALNTSGVPTWAPGLPAYGSARGARSLYWAAMQEGDRVLLLYIHHSGLSSHSFAAYTPCRPSDGCNRSPLTNLQVQMPNVGTNYTAVWLNPATLAQIGSSTTVPGNGTLFNLPVPAYPDFDVVLKLTANLPTNSLPCDCMGDTCF